MHEHRCLENIKKLYKSSVKCDDQNNYKEIIEVAMVYTPEGFTENSPISPSQYVTVKNPSAIKSLRQFLDTLEVKPKTYAHIFCGAKSKRKAIRSVSMLCSIIPKMQGFSKIDQPVKNIFTIGFFNILRLWCLQ